MNKIKFSLFIFLLVVCLPGNLIAQNQKKISLLDSLIFTEKESSISSYLKYKKACLDTNSANSSLIEQREEFLEIFNHASFQDSLYLNQELLQNIDKELHALYIRLVFLEGECTGHACRIPFSDTWKNTCNCPAEIIYSEILVLDDDPNGDEYAYYDLNSYFQLLSKADTFLRAYPKHKNSDIVQTRYNETLLRLYDIHVVLYEQDTTRLYSLCGLFDSGPWPYGFNIDHYKEMLEKYPGRYSRVLYSSANNLCSFIKGQDSVYVLIKNFKDNDVSKPGFNPYLHISIENPEYKDYVVLKYHFDKKTLRSFSKSGSKGKILKAVILKDYLVRIIE